jgi:hypothetical protein
MNGNDNDSIMRKIREEDSLHKMCTDTTVADTTVKVAVPKLSQKTREIIVGSIPPNVGSGFLDNKKLWASYNVDHNGKYFLMKKNGEMWVPCPAGVPDRVIGKGFGNESAPQTGIVFGGNGIQYETIRITGNDHFPVRCTGLMLQIQSSGGKKRTRKHRLVKKKRRRPKFSRKLT